MRRTNKHATRAEVFNNLIGGVNISDAPERIPNTDMQICKNFIYDKNKRLRGRGGLSQAYHSFNTDILNAYYDIDTNTLFVFLVNRDIYRVNIGTSSDKIGQLTGDTAPMCAKFMDSLWIASGDYLQYYDYSELKTIQDPNCPKCDICFNRLSRLAVGMTGQDRLTFSAVGDGTDWSSMTDASEGAIASSAQYIEVGYGDTGNILSVVPLSTDLLIIKSNGSVYQLISDMTPANWRVPPPIATGADAVGRRTATNIGSEVIFLSRRGLKTLSTVMDYGNIRASDIGDKFNSLITSEMWEPQMCHLRRHFTIMIRSTNNSKHWIAYNYKLGAATVIDFGVNVTDIIETVDDVVIMSGTDIYLWNESYVDDNGLPIEYEIKPKDVMGAEEMLIKSIDTKCSSDYAGTATLETDNLNITIPTNSRQKIRCNHSTPLISLDIKSNDAFTVDHIVLEVSDL